MAIKKLYLKTEKLPKAYYVKADSKKDEVIEDTIYNVYRKKRDTSVYGSKLHLKPADTTIRSIHVHIPSTQTEHLPTIVNRKTVEMAGTVIAYAQHYVSESGRDSVRTLIFADDVVSDDSRIVRNRDLTSAEELLNETVNLKGLSILRGSSMLLSGDIVDIDKSLGKDISFVGFNREDFARARNGEIDVTQVESRNYDILLNDTETLVSVKVLNSDENFEYGYKMFDRVELVEPEFTAYAVNDSNYGFAIKCKAIKQIFNEPKEQIKEKGQDSKK